MTTRVPYELVAQFYENVRAKKEPETPEDAFLMCNREVRRKIMKYVKRGMNPATVMMQMGIPLPKPKAKLKRDDKGNITPA